MPWRNRYITTRRHPIAIATYLFTLLLGVFFLTGLFDSQVLNEAIGTYWQLGWQWLLTIGGAAALAGIAMPQKQLEDALAIESTGAVACACGNVVYSIAIILVAGWSVPVWLLFGVLAAGLIARSIQARLDIRRLRRLAIDLGMVQS